ncbi:hypothetical protein [Microbispora sitophila]|uniref:hypothetical protein n=1 Tax=Microbispora sitophila TaxID=2771537 RepID=UPI00299F82B2|nr:hypothetical protein [Microbispora sitophila]
MTRDKAGDTMRELVFLRSRRLAWRERAAPRPVEPGDAVVRPFLAGRCDGDTLPIHRPVSRALQAGMALGLVDRSWVPSAGKSLFGGRSRSAMNASPKSSLSGPACGGSGSART